MLQMKKNIINKLLFGTALLALASCDVNSWNDKLDGFEGNPEPGDVKTIEYTLTDADYANLAANSTNKALAGEEYANDLKAVGTKHCFTDIITAKEYVPAFLSDPSFVYFTLDNGSSIKLTYNVTESLPAEITAIEGAVQYKVSEADYQEAWGSDKDYVNSFAPSTTASKNLPSILAGAYPDAEAGQYAIVNYNNSQQEPAFGGGGGGETPTFTPTSLIGSVELGQNYDLKGIVTGICTSGYILTDNTGSIFVYHGSAFDSSSIAIGDQMNVKADITAYNKGFQIAGASAQEEKLGSQSYTYPAPKVYTGAELDAAITRTTNEDAIYSRMTGTVVVNGTNVNILVDGATLAQGSAYYTPSDIKAKFVNGETVTVTGYFMAIAGGKYCSIVVTDVASGTKSVLNNAHAKSSVTIATTSENAVYYFDGKNWKVSANTSILNPADYTAMGQASGSLSSPDTYLPTYLKNKFPYAKAEDNEFVTYKYTSSGNTTYTCDEYTFDGANWVKNNGVVPETSQFVKANGKWMYDPNVTVVLPVIKGNATSSMYYQACVDWVYEHIDKPLGSSSITSGKFYVTKYGNNEYYCGTSAYQNNVDLRAAKAKEQYPEGYADMTDDQILDHMKNRFVKEVMPGALATLHPEAAPVAGMDVIYTITFGVYTGSNATYTVRYKVIDKAKFEFIDCTWDTPAE